MSNFLFILTPHADTWNESLKFLPNLLFMLLDGHSLRNIYGPLIQSIDVENKFGALGRWNEMKNIWRSQWNAQSTLTQLSIALWDSQTKMQVERVVGGYR